LPVRVSSSPSRRAFLAPFCATGKRRGRSTRS